MKRPSGATTSSEARSASREAHATTRTWLGKTVAKGFEAEVTDIIKQAFYSDSQARDEGGRWAAADAMEEHAKNMAQAHRDAAEKMTGVGGNTDKNTDAHYGHLDAAKAHDRLAGTIRAEKAAATRPTPSGRPGPGLKAGPQGMGRDIINRMAGAANKATTEALTRHTRAHPDIPFVAKGGSIAHKGLLSPLSVDPLKRTPGFKQWYPK